MDERIYQDLEYDFQVRWSDVHRLPGVPEHLWLALRERLGDENAGLIHPLELEADGSVVFLIVSEAQTAVLVTFDPPSTTTLHFLGNLGGGTYRETVTVDEEGRPTLEGVFEHEGRAAGPFHVRLDPPPPASDGPRPEAARARSRTEELLEQFRAWAAQQARPAS